MKTKSAILFDLDGTLFDTAPDLLISFNQLLRRYQHPEITIEELRPLLTHGSKYFINAFFNANAEPAEIEQLRAEYLTLYTETGHKNTQLFPGMFEMLQILAGKQIPWGIVTNKLTLHTLENLAAANLPFQPQVIVCGDTLAVAKPDPEPLWHACNLLSVDASQVIFIGDSEVDAEAGLRAGIDTFIVEHGYHNGVSSFINHPVAGFIREPREILQLIL